MGVIKNFISGVFKGRSYNIATKILRDEKPIYTSWGTDIYMSDFVNNAIDRVATEISKIEIKSVVENEGRIKVQNDDITRLFRFKPNPLQTTSDFLSSVEWLRRKNNNVFIYPQYEIVKYNGREIKRYTAFYPLNPQSVYIGVSPSGDVWEIKFYFEDGTSYIIPYSDLIHLKWRRGKNTIIGGGDDYGMVNNDNIRRVINALDQTIQGLPKSIEASLQVKGVYHAKTVADAVKLALERDEFEERIKTSKSGIVATDLAGEFTPVNIKAPEIDDETLKFLKSVIQERYGISAAILSGDYTSTQHNAFYQTAIEDFIVQFEQAFSAALFSPREQDVGHRIKCYYRKVRYYSTADKLQLAQLARETGIMTLNEINEMFGLEPFDDGDRRLQSLNYVNIKHVDEYQKARVKGNTYMPRPDEEPPAQKGSDEENE